MKTLFLLYLIKYKVKKELKYMSEKVLVVDDERDIANLLEVYLQNENYVVYKYYCAKDAIPCIENEDIDLAILDVMPAYS